MRLPSEQLQRLRNDKVAIQSALIAQGIVDANSHGFDDFAEDIANIVSDKVPSNYGKVTLNGTILTIE